MNARGAPLVADHRYLGRLAADRAPRPADRQWAVGNIFGGCLRRPQANAVWAQAKSLEHCKDILGASAAVWHNNYFFKS